MLDYVVSTLSLATTDSWWQGLRPRLTIIYALLALFLLIISVTGNVRLLGEVGQTFGGFFWAIDTNGHVVIISSSDQSLTTDASASTLTSNDYIAGVTVKNTNGRAIFSWQQHGHATTAPLSAAYAHAAPGDLITYTIQQNTTQTHTSIAAEQFTFEMWLQSYGIALLGGMSWLLVGFLLLMASQEWMGAVEAITFLPPAMLFLLYSHWGNVQQAYPTDAVIQLLWIPAFALLGAAFIHLSLTYRPDAMSSHRRPTFVIDALPYLSLLALLLFEWASYLLFGSVASRPNFIIALSYGVIGGMLSAGIGCFSLLRLTGILPGKAISANVRHHLGDLLIIWIGGVGLGFCLGILPILLLGHPLLPLEIFYVLAAAYPILLFYAIRSLRLIDQLHITLEQREEALRIQQKTAEELRQANRELQSATSLLLHADAHLRSVLSQRIHDQPKQQALRIRSLLGHWQHKLRVEAEHDAQGKVTAQPVIEAMGKVRKISEELEGDLRKLQLLVEDAYQRRSLGVRLHLEKLVREDLPALHPESPLKVKADLAALEALSRELEQSEEGTKIAEAISYTVTQAMLNVYNHAGANFATIQAYRRGSYIEVYITDDGRGFNTASISPEKTSMFKALLKAREAGGTLSIQSVPRPQPQHGTSVMLRVPIPHSQQQQRLYSRAVTRIADSRTVDFVHPISGLPQTCIGFICMGKQDPPTGIAGLTINGEKSVQLAHQIFKRPHIRSASGVEKAHTQCNLVVTHSLSNQRRTFLLPGCQTLPAQLLE